jgi:hypothetical protein
MSAPLSQRDRRLLMVLGVLGAILLIRLALLAIPSSDTAVVAPTAINDTIQAREKRLDRARNLSAVVPAHRQTLANVEADLALREKGLIQADTAAQAQAQLMTVVRRVARAENLDVRGSELGQVRPLGADYGEVQVAVTVDGQVEQLVNFLAAVTAQPELVSTSEIRIGATYGKEKHMVSRIVMSGVVPRRLVPERKTAGGGGGSL